MDNAQHTTPNVLTIFGRTHTAPQVNDGLVTLRAALQSEVEQLKSGRVTQPPRVELRPARGLSGLLGKKERMLVEQEPREMTPEERYARTITLIANYDEITAHLREMEGQYRAFIWEIASGTWEVVQQKLGELRAEELNRREEACRTLELGDRHAFEDWEQRREQVARSTVTWIRSAMLIIKKLELIHQSLTTLLDEHGSQQGTLQKLKARLETRSRMHAWDVRMAAHQRELEAFTQFALNIESYLGECFGPLQQLMDELYTIDDRMFTALSEIEALSNTLAQPNPDAFDEDDELLDFLVAGHVKLQHLDDATRALDATADELHELFDDPDPANTDADLDTESLELLLKAQFLRIARRCAA